MPSRVFIYVDVFNNQGVALESHAGSEDGLLQFEVGDVILVVADTHEVCVCTYKELLFRPVALQRSSTLSR